MCIRDRYCTTQMFMKWSQQNDQWRFYATSNEIIDFAGASASPHQETVVGKPVHRQTDGIWARRRKHSPGVGPVRPVTRRACRGGMLRSVRASRSCSSSRERSPCRQALKYPCRQNLFVAIGFSALRMLSFASCEAPAGQLIIGRSADQKV